MAEEIRKIVGAFEVSEDGQAELERLRKENVQLRMERDILKKTTAFFATLRKELIHQREYEDQEEARASIFEYIEVFYNRIRRHSSLDGLSPEQYEEQAWAPLGPHQRRQLLLGLSYEQNGCSSFSSPHDHYF